MTAAELFDDAAMAAGYARDRPPVHPHLMDRLIRSSAWPGPVATAVDVGCGAGASTAALGGLAAVAIGVDPYAPMVRAAAAAVPGAAFAVAAAEALPCASASVDLLTAAGSLNYADVPAAVREADRVLTPDGLVAVSNYSFGRPADPTVVPAWPERFEAQFPRPRSTPVTVASFAGTPFRAALDEQFEVTLPMTVSAYLAYVLTDTGVARAVADGRRTDEIRAWCVAQLAGPFGPEQPVVFDASLLVLRR